MKPPKVLKSQRMYQGRIISVSKERIQLPQGIEEDWEMVHHPGAAAVVALDGKNRICLIKQYRHSCKDWIWEIPAGRLEPGESHAQTAARELIEETGTNAQLWHSLGQILSSPGIFDEVISLWLATGLLETNQQLEPGELLEVHWIGLTTAIEWCNDGTITDGKTLIGIYRAQAHLSKTTSPVTQ